MAVPASETFIRQATPDDEAAYFEICLKTANSGTDASALYSDPLLPGYVWSVPYLKFAPDNAFALVHNGDVIGYCVGTPDSDAFTKTVDEKWFPEVRKTLEGREFNGELDQHALNRINNPEPRNPALVDAYPAHLHINVLPVAQSGGWGRKLIETQLDRMRAQGVKGVHLGVSMTNDRAKGFYAHVGFTDISTEEQCAFAMSFE